jgi:hypothetical protein
MYPKKVCLVSQKSKGAMGVPDGIQPGSLNNKRTQVKFRKLEPEKKKCLG